MIHDRTDDFVRVLLEPGYQGALGSFDFKELASRRCFGCRKQSWTNVRHVEVGSKIVNSLRDKFTQIVNIECLYNVNGLTILINSGLAF
jgi:hypothetical protein